MSSNKSNNGNGEGANSEKTRGAAQPRPQSYTGIFIPNNKTGTRLREQTPLPPFPPPAGTPRVIPKYS